jgi:mannose-6-phosphate isomerase-like protein (cupin superfamily)
MSNTIELTATGERITFLEDTAATNGRRLLLTVSLPANSKGPGPHIHHRQTESFEVTGGRLGVQLGDKRIELLAGGSTVVPAGMVHDWWNAGADPVEFRAALEPALNFEWMLREIFASCNRRRSAEPSPWDGSYVITRMSGEYSLANVPMLIQRFVFPILGSVGTLLGLVKVAPRHE